MAQWKETLEPYIKVYERIKTTTIVPTAGEDLIIGATIISDSGPSYPVLITSQREFLNTFASQDITKDYVEGLNKFYDDGTSDVASTMWLNAYRLAGSTNMLIVRATKGADMNYVVPAGVGDNGEYIIRDGQLLKHVSAFCLVEDRLGGNSSPHESGWAISVNEIGIIGNLMSDDGPVYEYFAADLRELVEYLNSTSKFFSPNYEFYVWKNNTFTAFDENVDAKPDLVKFKEVYLAKHFLYEEGFGSSKTNASWGTGTGVGTGRDYGTKADGLAYLLATKAGDGDTVTTMTGTNNDFAATDLVDLNSGDYSGWTGSSNNKECYFINTYNSNSDIKVRIRRFNHDAVVLRDDIKPTIYESDPSPYDVLTDVITQFEGTLTNGTTAAKQRILERDFYEVAVLDPSLDKDPLSFCVGNIPGRGDLTLDELNDTLKMINLHFDKMEDLELGYYNPENASSGNGGSGQGNQSTPSHPSIPGNGNGTVWNTVDWPDIGTEPGGTSKTQELLNTGGLTLISEDDLPNYSAPVGTIVGVIGSSSEIRENTYYVPVRQNVENINEIDIDNHTLRSGTYSEFSGYTPGNNDVVYPTSGDGLEFHKGNLVKLVDISEEKYAATDGLTTFIHLNVGRENFTSTPEENGKSYVAVRGYDFNDDDVEDDIVLYTLSYNNSSAGGNQIFRNLGINTDFTSLLNVTPGDLMRSISSITEDEVYTTEGLTDLGNTDITFQTYLCNMAKNENYFYPISTLYSTNYLAIANYRTRLAQDSHKLYTSAPWDIDSGTVGFKFHACPSVIYWEAVSRNRSMNREFASVFGFSSNGQVLYTNPVTEFTKKQRQLLLSKQVNTVMWNTQNQTWNMNDCYTMTSENHILNEDGNSRLFIRINKAIPTLLRPLIGRKLNNSTYADAETILKYWFERTILTMQYSVSDYKVTIANLEANDDQARRQNKMYVLVECLFARSMKYVIVYSDALDMGMEFTGEIV